MRLSGGRARAEELQPEHLSPTEACILNAYRKARVLAKKFPDALVIGADTEVLLKRRVFGKPKDRKEAEGLVTLGDSATVALGVRDLRNDLVSSPGLDDKVGVWVVMEALRLLREEKPEIVATQGLCHGFRRVHVPSSRRGRAGRRCPPVWRRRSGSARRQRRSARARSGVPPRG